MSGTPIPELSQDASELNLRWRAHDAVNISWRVRGVDWSGIYRAEVRDQPRRSGTLLGTFVVTAVYEPVTNMTLFTIVMADTSGVVGDAWWDLQQDGGRTVLGGRVYVTPDVTV